MEEEIFGFQLFWKGTDKVYWGSQDINSVLYMYEHCVFKKDLEFRIVTEKNPCSVWREW